MSSTLNTTASDEATLPAVHALHLGAVVGQWGIEAERLFEGFALSHEGLARPGAQLPVSTYVELVERARAWTGEPGLGFYLGQHMQVSAHGPLGFAVMTSGTLREALEVAIRYVPIRTSALKLRLHVDGDLAALALDELASLGTARDVITFALLLGIQFIGRALTGQPLVGSADVKFEEPTYFQRFADLAAGEVRFSQPTTRLVFDAGYLDLRLTMADPAAHRLACAQCEHELEEMHVQSSMVAQVRERLDADGGGFRSLEDVAKAMHMSPRTLKRQLAAHGTSYSELLAERRRDRATLLLRSRDLTVEEVAARLGYSDTANFTRAFRRWTGTTPKAYRRTGLPNT